MADEFEARTFVGDVNPPADAAKLQTPRATAPARVAATADAPADAVRAEGQTVAGFAPAPPSKSKGTFRIVDKPDGRRMYHTVGGQTIDLGTITVPRETLDAVGKYYESGKTWEVPESYARAFERGEPGFTEHVANSFEGARAGMHRGLTGYLAITKQMPYEEALARSEPDLVKAQLTELPQAAWGDTRLQKLIGASKWALGAMAEILPSQLGSAQAGLSAAPKVALAATAGAAAAGALPALATPTGVLTVAGVSWQYGAFDFTSKVTAGSLALDMKAKGIDDKTIETVAPAAGMFAGLLETLHVKYLPAPFRRALVGKVLGNPAVKKAMTTWAANYFKEVGAEVSVEVAQQYIEGFATNIMAEMDNRPDVAKSLKTMNAEAGKVALKTAVGMGLLKAPGAAFEAMVGGEEKAAPAPAAEAPTVAVEKKAAPAAAIEKELVAETPEVGVALTQLNETLDPTAPEAEFVYEEMGAELAGDETAVDAVTAKVEALRLEMREILAAEENTPEEQGRVADIQREIGLLEGMKGRMEEVAPEAAAPTAPVVPAGAKKVYHFSDVEIKQFEERGKGVWLTSNQYGVVRKRTSGNVRNDFLLDVENLKFANEKQFNFLWKLPLEERINTLKAQGFDGVKLRVEGDLHYLVFDAKNILPATEAPKKRISTAREKIQKKVVAAREKKLVTDLNNTLAMVKELESARTRLEKAGKATKFIDEKIVDLMGEVYKIDEERIALAEGAMPESTAALELRPATLESIEKTAFTEGRKDVTTKRAAQVKEVAEQHSLSDRDIRSLIKTRNLGVMSDFDFKKFIDDLRKNAKTLADKKQAAIELRASQDAKQLKNESSLRRINNLPPVSKMTAEQMRTYAELIEGYETGETFWTPKRIEALKNTRWSGAETMQDVLRKAAELFNVPLEELGKVTISEFDRFRYDTALARRHPLFNFMVDEVKTAALKNEAAYFAAREEHFKLAEAAAKSRRALDVGKKSVWERIADWLAPQQEALMAYLEAQTPEEKASAALALTPEELKLAQFEEKFYADAYNYLLAGKDLAGSRFADGGYFAHFRRPLSEILRGVSEAGIRATVSDIAQTWKLSETRFTVTDQKTGEPLGMRKFLRQTLFRSGEMTPSKNVVRSTDIYMRQFFKKKGLDEAVPSVETLVKAVGALDQTEEGKQAAAALESFVRDYLNAKKGQAAMLGVVQGGKVDALIRFVTSAMSLMTMGANTVVQAAAPVGEAAAKTVALGYRNYARALRRRASKKGRAIAEKYKFFTGEGVIEEFLQPGQNVETRLMMLAFGLFKWSRVNTMKDLLLGSMTDAEYAAGEISNERLAQIKKDAGRWLDVGDAKSVYGTTSVWKAETQFKSWAIPIMSSSLDILGTLIKSAAKGKNLLTPQQQSEVLRIALTTSLVTLAAAVSGDADKDDDSYLGRLKYTVMREMTTLIQAMNPAMFLVGPAAFAWMVRLYQNMALMVQLEKTEKTGELRGWKNLKKQLSPAFLKQMGVIGGDRKPKTAKPTRLKKPKGD